MKKTAKFLCALALACASVAAFGADFSAQVAASTLDPKMEWWFNLPADSAPNIVQTERVYFHQDFSVFAFFDKAAVKDGDFDIEYSIYSVYPDGKRAKAADNIRLKGKKLSKDIIVASNEYVGVCFDKNYREGVYTFEIEARDKIAGAVSKSSTQVRLSEWTPPAPMLDAALVKKSILGFYLNPSPDTLYSLFFSKSLDLEQKGAPNDLNFINLGFLRAAFKRNSFLLPPMRENFAGFKPLDRAKIIFLFAVLDEARIDFNILTPAERDYQDAMRKAKIPDPYAEWDPVIGAAQIDMLWGEFFADGTYKPIRRIMDLLAYAEEAKFTQACLSAGKRPESRADWKKFMYGAYHSVALQSLLRNSERFPLVKKYCMWALENGGLPDSTYRLFGGAQAQ